MARVEGGEHGEMAAHTHAHDEQLVGAALHLINFTVDNLLHVLETLRLDQVLTCEVPSASTTLVILFEDNWALHADDVH